MLALDVLEELACGMFSALLSFRFMVEKLSNSCWAPDMVCEIIRGVSIGG